MEGLALPPMNAIALKIGLEITAWKVYAAHFEGGNI